MPEIHYALSIKQPWATLLLHGLKSIEIRNWPTARRGRVLIHAARVPDAAPTAWALLPDHLRTQAQLMGGIVGACEMTNCLAYRTPEAFAADQVLHRNLPEWFRPPVLYGFVLAQPECLPFRAYPGWLRFFPVGDDLPVRRARGAGKGAAGILKPDPPAGE